MQAYASACNYIKKETVFPVNFAIFLRPPFYRLPPVPDSSQRYWRHVLRTMAPDGLNIDN